MILNQKGGEAYASPPLFFVKLASYKANLFLVNPLNYISNIL